ncbi:conserved hypothetical protein [Cupriavidus oxalaticus]|uniref:Uncharacterized protein n=2 Tax=Cupriavidus oxalaticus TaxID=96344 RepID=A0A375FSX3_9BURK|nr:conserved hypothetical protein [Cupriavidus oxalaticus]SPC19751.1 conserved hypothetical protein [Cupriavidus oxalaticus]
MRNSVFNAGGLIPARGRIRMGALPIAGPAGLSTYRKMTSQAHAQHPAHRPAHPSDATEAASLNAPDIPFGSLEAAALAELPYTFRPSGTCTRYYNEYFG